MYLFHGFRFSFDTRGCVSSWNLAKIGFILSRQLLALEFKDAGKPLQQAMQEAAKQKRAKWGKGGKVSKSEVKKPRGQSHLMFRFLRSFINHHPSHQVPTVERDIRSELACAYLPVTILFKIIYLIERKKVNIKNK
jgi:hypothetical protein